MYRFLQVLFYFLFRIFYRIEILGEENIPDTDKLIVVGNHRSNLDPVVISVFFKRQIFWMAKKELYENKLFGKFIGALGAFPVDRFSIDVKAIKTALRHIKDGEVLGIFPEGTRVKEKNYALVKQGTAIIAYRARATVLPVKLEGTYRIFGKFRIIFKKPIDMSKIARPENEEYELISQDIMRRVYGDKEIGNLPSWSFGFLWRCKKSR